MWPTSKFLLVATAVAVAGAMSAKTSAEARSMHAEMDYSRYLLEKDAIANELQQWMDKFQDVAKCNGWIPATEARSGDDVEEDHRQRFFLAKQLVHRLEKENPQATFTTDSPFSLMTSEEFAKYVQNSFLGRQRRPIRSGDFSRLGINEKNGRVSAEATAAPRTQRDGPVAPDFPPEPTTDAPPEPTPSSSTPVTSRPGGNGTVDWSAHACMPAIQNQGGCGSCWAFAVVSAVETTECLVTNASTLIKYSEQNLASCDTEKNAGCDGGVPVYAAEYVVKNGLCTAAEDPYTSGNGQLAQCNTSCQRHKTAMTGVDLLESSEGHLVTALAKNPVVVAVQAGNDAWKQYQSGILEQCPSPSASIDHAVVAVGMDHETIKIRNSWSTQWGEQGYIRLARSADGLGTCKVYEAMVNPRY